MIPRQFHWVWLGDKKLPIKERSWMQTWREMHPFWRCIIWAEHPDLAHIQGFETRPLPPLINVRFYEEIENAATGSAMNRDALMARSNIVRYEVIARDGGVYMDTGVECFQPIDELLVGVRLFVCDRWGPCRGNYMFGGVPNHPALWAVVGEMAGSRADHPEPSSGPNSLAAGTGASYLYSRLRRYEDLVIFPSMLFNPLGESGFEVATSWLECSYGNLYHGDSLLDHARHDRGGELQSEPLGEPGKLCQAQSDGQKEDLT